MLLGVALSSHVSAGSITQWRMTSVERAPVLLVARVDSVRAEFRLPQGATPWRAEIWAMIADLTVLRSFSSAGRSTLPPNSHIDVRFFKYNYGAHQTFVNGPPLVSLSPNQVVILPLFDNSQPSSQPWRLLGEQGVGLAVPARATLSDDTSVAGTRRAFILRELVNSLAAGMPDEVATAASYIHEQGENLAPELMPSLDREIGHNGRRWTEIEVDLMGASRPTIEDLRINDWRDSRWNPSVDHGYSVALAILNRLSAWPESRQWIMEAIVAKAAAFPEGASLLAKDYASDANFSALLRTALSEHRPGAIYVATALIEEGNKTRLQDALKSAQEFLRTPVEMKQTRVEELDRSAARTLLADHGEL